MFNNIFFLYIHLLDYQTNKTLKNIQKLRGTIEILIIFKSFKLYRRLDLHLVCRY